MKTFESAILILGSHFFDSIGGRSDAHSLGIGLFFTQALGQMEDALGSGSI